MLNKIKSWFSRKNQIYEWTGTPITEKVFTTTICIHPYMSEEDIADAIKHEIGKKIANYLFDRKMIEPISVHHVSDLTDRMVYECKIYVEDKEQKGNQYVWFKRVYHKSKGTCRGLRK